MSDDRYYYVLIPEFMILFCKIYKKLMNVIKITSIIYN